MHRSQGPRLKNGTDIQLQTAFNDGNWTAAIRLAEKRAKVSGDEYFQVRQPQTQAHPCSIQLRANE